jgi:hypothetical protein
VLDAFFPEWDIRIDIQAALWAIPGVRLQYVAGHQDKTQPNHSLELLEQLKVDADRIASEDHDLLHQQRPYVVMSSHTKAHLVSADETVTSKHDDFLATQATVPPLITYLSDKYSWSTAVVETINGKAHGQALKRNKLRQSHYIRRWVLLTINIDGITYHEMTSDQEVVNIFSIIITNLLTLQNGFTTQQLVCHVL